MTSTSAFLFISSKAFLNIPLSVIFVCISAMAAILVFFLLAILDSSYSVAFIIPFFYIYLILCLVNERASTYTLNRGRQVILFISSPNQFIKKPFRNNISIL